MKRKFIDNFLLSRPRLMLAAIAVLSLLAALLVKDLRFDASTGNLLPDDSATVQNFEQFRATFGDSEVLVVALYDPDTIFTSDNLKNLDRLTREITRSPLVERVLSLTNTPTVRNRFGMPQMVTAYELFPDNAEGVARFEAEMMGLVNGMLVSADKRVGILYIHPVAVESGDQLTRDVELVETVEALLDDAAGEFHVVGSPKIKQAMVEASKRDTVVAVTVTTVLVAIILMFVFRNIWAVVIPLATYFLSLLWTGALMALAGVAINSWTSIIAPLLLVISIADSIHILATYRHSCSPKDGRLAALRLSLTENLTPCALTSLTTMLGLLSLTLGKIPVMTNFGVFAAIGVWIAFLLSFTFIPALLRVAPGISAAFCDSEANIDLSIDFLKRLIIRRPAWIATGFLLAGGIFAYGASQVSADTNFMNLFKSNHPLAQDSRFVEQHFGGTGPLEVVLQAAPGELKTVGVLHAIDAFQRRLEGLTGVDRTYSVVDLVKLANRYQHHGDPEQLVVPDDQATIDGFALLANLAGKQEQMARLITPDFSQTRLLVRLHILGSTELQELIRTIEAEMSNTLPSSVSGQVTGTAAVFAAATNYLVEIQINSFFGACITILLVVVVVFRSLRIGLFSALPTLFPILAVFGLMGLTGITLDFFNVMIAPLVIGLAVDETIHFLSRFQGGMQAGLSVRQSVLKTMHEIDTAIVSTSMILCLGFLAIAFSASLNGSLQFGLLTASAMFIALVSTLFGLPALLMLFWKKGDPRTAGREIKPVAASAGVPPRTERRR